MDSNLAFERNATSAARSEDLPSCMCAGSSASPTCARESCRMLGRAPNAVSPKAARGESRNEAGLNVCCLDVCVWNDRVSDGWMSRALSDH